jgi:hypothetical protein
MNNMIEDTKTYFRIYKGFKKGIIAVFGEWNEEKQAAQALFTLKQKGLCAKYTAEFLRNASKVIIWGDGALHTQYYRKLKDFVKDELAREEKPENLKELHELAVKIDNRLYERAMEKKGVYDHDFNQKQGFRGTRAQYKHDLGDPMELDATKR